MKETTGVTQYVVRGVREPGLEFRECRERRQRKEATGGGASVGFQAHLGACQREMIWLVFMPDLRGTPAGQAASTCLTPPVSALSPGHVPKTVFTSAKPDLPQGILELNGVTGQVLTQGWAWKLLSGDAGHPTAHPTCTPGAPEK